MAIIEITSSNFEEEVLNSEKPVLIDFWAEWCVPCKMLSPVVDEIAEEREDIKVAKVNVDQEGGLAVKYGVMNIPTLILIKNGEVDKVSVGVKDKEELLQIFFE